MTRPPKLKPGTPMQTRRRDGEEEARTPASRWHTIRWWLRHHMTRDAEGEWDDTTGWKAERKRHAGESVRKVSRAKLTGTRAAYREEARLAQHAQELRAEAVTGVSAGERKNGGRSRQAKGKEERDAYFGRGEYRGAGVERRELAGDAAYREQQRYEAQQQHEWEQRQARKRSGGIGAAWYAPRGKAAKR